jgi:thymidylate kinase
VGVFVVLEGLSGCGKSTVSRALETEGWFRISPPTNEFSGIRRILDDDPDGCEARHLLFLSGLARAAKFVAEALKQDRNVVADSWIHRTNATHVVLGSRLGEVAVPSLPVPDHVLFLDCTDEMRRSRRQLRGTEDPYWKAMCEKRSPEIRSYYLENFPELTRVNANLNISAVIDAVKEQLSA